jgi:hypothetical protein
MTKRNDINSKYETVNKRYGATTGASKGTKPAPPAKLKPRLSKSKASITLRKDF